MDWSLGLESWSGALESLNGVLDWNFHGSKVSRESNLRSAPYNRPIGVRAFVKNVTSLSENQHNS